MLRLLRSLNLGVIARGRQRERARERKGVEEGGGCVWKRSGGAVELMSAASMTLQAGGAECKPRGPCGVSSCACESEKSVVALKQEREEDEAGEKDDGAVDVEKLQQKLIDLTETLLTEVT